jgi:hypothetical protein
MKNPTYAEAEQAIQTLLAFLPECRPESAEADRIAASIEPIVFWHNEHSIWKKKCSIKERFRKFIDEKR